MFTKKTLIAITALIAFIITGCTVSNNNVSVESLGSIQADSTFEGSAVPDVTSYSKVAAGESKVIERAFENAPPMIPHDIEGMLPITTNNNSCLGCHDPAVAAMVNATAVPKSHMFNMRTQIMLTSVSSARYNCSQCHAPQSNNKIAFGNEFQADFRAKDGSISSNLLDNLNEGVK